MTTSVQSHGLFERKPYLLAILLSVLLIAWMASGDNQAKSLDETSSEEAELIPRVEVTQYRPMRIQRSIDLYGRTEPERSLKLSTEVEGRVAEILMDEGQLVQQGQAIVRLATEDKEAQLASAQALVKQREIEYKGAQSLSERGLQGESLLAQAKAALVAAEANVQYWQVMLDKSLIRAPFTGVLDMRQVELGSFVHKGDALFNLVDLDPLIVSANLTERHIGNLTRDTKVEVELVDGKTVPGRISYIASVSAQGTNTFPIEIEIDNPSQKMKAGISSQLHLRFGQEQAIKVTPALLSLDEKGNLGVKTVKDQLVVFNPIDLIKSDKDGVWLGGFDGVTQVITLGQGFVRPGDRVIASVKQN